MTHRDDRFDVRPHDGWEDGFEDGSGADSRTDPRADLVAAWAALTPPAPPASLADADPRTRAAVARMRAAWEALTPPTAAVPGDLVARCRRPALPAPTAWRPLAAAALLLVALAGPLLLSPEPVPHPAPAPPDAGPTPPGVGATTAHAAPAPGPAPASGRHVVSASPEALELRSGPVRLLLLTPDGSL